MNINEKQRNVLIVVAVIIAGILLFPPFHKVSGTGVIRGSGHYWLLDPPFQYSIDVASLFIQWLGVLIVGGIVFFIFKDKEE